MSIDINWDKLNEDNVLNDSIRDFLNDQVQGLELPDYLMNIKVTNFSLGSIAPEVTIRHIGDPFPDFYNDEIPGSEKPFTENGSDTKSPLEASKKIEINKRRQQQDSNSQAHHQALDQSSNVSYSDGPLPSSLDKTPTDEGEVPSESLKHVIDEDVSNDIQFIVEIDYKGDITIEVQVDLLLNYPSPGFITLPVKLKIVDLGIHSLAVIAHVSKVVFLSFLCDINDEQFDDIIKNPTLSKNNRNRIDIVRSMRIESEIGDNQGEGSVLRNVGKVERFLTEMVRGLLRDELAWPGWISFDFNEDDDSDDQSSEGEEGMHG